MNINTRLWQIRSDDIPGQATVTNRSTGEHHTVKLADVPSVHSLAMMKEADFDRTMQDLVA